MKDQIYYGIAVLFLFTSVSLCVPVSQIYYTVEQIGAERWQYTYEVSNTGLVDPIEQFTIYFDYNLYSNLIIETQDPPASDWDEIRWQPDAFGSINGGYDTLAIGSNSGISYGQTVGGFSVSFDWLGQEDEPGEQEFSIIDPADNFTSLFSGITIPEPMSICLLAGGVLMLKRRK